MVSCRKKLLDPTPQVRNLVDFRKEFITGARKEIRFLEEYLHLATSKAEGKNDRPLIGNLKCVWMYPYVFQVH